MQNLPIWPFLLFAAVQLGAFVGFTEQDSPLRLVGVGIAVVIMIFVVSAWAIRDKKAKP
jgi:hypothetical protein